MSSSTWLTSRTIRKHELLQRAGVQPRSADGYTLGGRWDRLSCRLAGENGGRRAASEPRYWQAGRLPRLTSGRPEP